MNILVRFETESLWRAIGEFSSLTRSAADTHDVLLEFQDLRADLSNAFLIRSESRPAVGAGEVVMILEPSPRFLELLIALRATAGNPTSFRSQNALRDLL